MKYIKLYKEINSYNYSYIDTHCIINWNMIYDVIDMALEYLDVGHNLIIKVISIDIRDDKTLKEYPVLYYLDYSHAYKSEQINKELFSYWSTKDKNYFKNIKIEYNIYFDPNLYSLYFTILHTKELIERVCLIYSNENIKTPYVKNINEKFTHDNYTLQLKRIGVTDFINHNMIEDLKDLSMELLDINYTLHIMIWYNKNKPLGEIYLNHSESYYNPIILNVHNKPMNIHRIGYSFDFMLEHNYLDNKEMVGEILYRIKNMYPNEDISTII